MYCPHTQYCRIGCNENYLDCYIYEVIESYLNYQQRKGRINRRICRSEHNHKQYEELPSFGNVNLTDIIDNLLKNKDRGEQNGNKNNRS